MDYSPPGFCVHGIFQERILEQASFPPPGDLPDLGNQHVFPVSPALAADSLPGVIWASLVVQLVKNPPGMWDTWVQSLGWEDPMEKGKTTHSSILAWRIPRTV